jgi:hypothetical protein
MTARALVPYGLVLLGTMLILGCRAEPRSAIRTDREAAADPAARLGELLRRGIQPGQLAAQERHEVEELVRAVLPEVSGELAGHRWRVTYLDLPEADFIAVDLLTGATEWAPRAAWIHLFYRSPVAEPREEYPDRLGPYPARAVPGHHLWVRAGNVEVRAFAEAEELRQPGRLEALVEGFALAQLARY